MLVSMLFVVIMSSNISFLLPMFPLRMVLWNASVEMARMMLDEHKTSRKY
jgi:hypothetical protein